MDPGRDEVGRVAAYCHSALAAPCGRRRRSTGRGAGERRAANPANAGTPSQRSGISRRDLGDAKRGDRATRQPAQGRGLFVADAHGRATRARPARGRAEHRQRAARYRQAASGRSTLVRLGPAVIDRKSHLLKSYDRRVGYPDRRVPGTQTGVRVELASEGIASVATGLPVLDHLVGELARTARLRIALEVAPGSADEEVAAAGRGLGEALAAARRSTGRVGTRLGLAAGRRGACGRRLSRSRNGRIVASNVDFSGQRVGGLAERRRRAVPQRARGGRRAQHPHPRPRGQGPAARARSRSSRRSAPRSGRAARPTEGP